MSIVSEIEVEREQFYRLDEIISRLFDPISRDHKQYLQLLRRYFQEHLIDLTSPRDNIIKIVQILNRLVSAMEIINTKIIQAVLKLNDEKKIVFATKYGIQVKDISEFKFPGYAIVEMKKALSDVIDEGFEDILAEYRRTLPEPAILRHDNSISSDGRHIFPGIASITDVVAVNLVCDVIDGSYSVLDNSITAQECFSLYSFTPKKPSGFLIVQEPINPLFLRCHNPWLSTINFKLTDQSKNLLDTRSETVSINLLVKS